jgi:hypothetical protein
MAGEALYEDGSGGEDYESERGLGHAFINSGETAIAPDLGERAFDCKRPRRLMPGMILHRDGSRHVWIQGLPALDLIVTMDDATSAIYSAFLCEEEGTASTLRACRKVFSQQGLPMSFYTDWGSYYFHTDEAGGPVDRKRLTQVGLPLERLGVEHIAAYSPQA